jgi:hypothetical protein
MFFHEITGLLLGGLFIIHILLNRNTITLTIKKRFSKNTLFKTKINFFINVLLLLCFMLIIITGLLTSQALLNLPKQDNNLRSLHHFGAALTMILVGIHLGLHSSFILTKRGLPSSFFKFLKYPLIIVILINGSYALVNNNFSTWLIEPFKTTINNKNESLNKDLSINNNTNNKTVQENKHPLKNNENKSQNSSFLIILNHFSTYGRIIILFSIITFYLKKILAIKKRKLL